MDTYNPNSIARPTPAEMTPEIRDMLRGLFDDVLATIDATPGKEMSEKIGYGVMRHPPKSTFDALNKILSIPGGCNPDDPGPDQPHDAFLQRPEIPLKTPLPASASSRPAGLSAR
jgi:hypothetical protein